MSRTHRFYVDQNIKLKKDFWLHDEALVWQISRVLRFKEGDEVVLFDGLQTDRLYELVKIKPNEIHLKMVTELARKLPEKHIYLFWSLLKRDNNEHILQKATELGVSNFVPLITERTIKKDFNIVRARKIIKEAAEQCGRSDIPVVREQVHLEKVIEEYNDKVDLVICQQGAKDTTFESEKIGVFVGPEGGWSPNELKLFEGLKLKHLSLGQFELRAETAAVVATTKLF